MLDALTWFGCNPAQREDVPVGDLRAMLDQTGIHRACVYSQRAVRYDMPEGNDEVLALCRDDARFLPIAIIDPRPYFGVTDELTRCWDAGVRMFRLCTDEHGYPVHTEALRPVLMALEERGALLQVSALPWARASDLARATEGYTFPILLTEFSYGNLADVLAVAARWPKFHLDTCRGVSPSNTELLVGAVGAQRVIFTSGWPLLYPGGPLRMIQDAALSAAQKDCILGGNLRRLMGEVTA